MTIGARVLKTGLAVALAIYLSELLGFHSPIIAAIAAIAVQPTITRSWKYVADQLLTNIMGATVALTLGHYFGQNALAVGLVCIIVILISIRLKMEATINLTLVTVVTIMEAGSDNFLFALDRFYMVIIGMAAAVAINLVILPPRPEQQFNAMLTRVFAELSLLLRTALSGELRTAVYRTSRNQLDELYRQLEERYSLFEDESDLWTRTSMRKLRELVISKQVMRTFDRGKDILDIVDEHLERELANADVDWKMMYDEQIEQLVKVHEQLLLKRAGKIRNEAKLDLEWTEFNQGQHAALPIQVAIAEYRYHLQRLDRMVHQSIHEQ